MKQNQIIPNKTPNRFSLVDEKDYKIGQIVNFLFQEGNFDFKVISKKVSDYPFKASNHYLFERVA